ncbi:MAG: hypothetical protein Q8O67_15120 [Deltaproteobacteria bacterium]|nr:hypothetical protein [Deltaproteobacteria bacterium]
MLMLQPDQLLDRLVKEWRPPHHRPLNGTPTGTPFDAAVLAQVLNASFFASLRAEEGTAQPHGVVLVHGVDDLVGMYPPWSLHQLATPLRLDAERLAKVAALAADDDAFVIVAAADPPVILGFGQARRSGALLAADRHPRIRAVGPGDLVFYRGDNAVFRYRAGCVEELRPDFFIGADEPRGALISIGRQLFAHWEHDSHMASTKDIVGPALSRCIQAITARGRGGMLAILAPDERPPSDLVAAAAYPMQTIKLGDAVVAAYESAMVMNGIEQRTMGPGPDYLPARALNDQELGREAEWRDARDHERRLVDRVGAMASIDGAVLLTAGLDVVAFGCKLPGIDGERPRVLTAPPKGVAQPEVFDLTKRGTRHAAAAVFAGGRHGRLALTVSADGPAACFMWSEQFGHIMHWPVHVGVFAPSTWDTAG